MYYLMLGAIAVTIIVIAILLLRSEQSHTYRNNTAPKSNYLTRRLKIPDNFSNLSVRKTDNGYKGLIIENGESISYPYEIEFDNDGQVTNLVGINLDYSCMMNCKSAFRGVKGNGIQRLSIFTFCNEDWAIGNCFGTLSQPHPCVNAICMFKLSDPLRTFKIIKSPSGVNPLQAQKYWSPFEHNGKLYVTYSIVPHVVLEIDGDTASEVYRTGNTVDSELTGGVAPILIDDYYLAIGQNHTFYTFEAIPPFRITSVSKEFKLDGEATGLSRSGDKIYVSCAHGTISEFLLHDVYKK